MSPVAIGANVGLDMKRTVLVADLLNELSRAASSSDLPMPKYNLVLP